MDKEKGKKTRGGGQHLNNYCRSLTESPNFKEKQKSKRMFK